MTQYKQSFYTSVKTQFKQVHQLHGQLTVRKKIWILLIFNNRFDLLALFSLIYFDKIVQIIVLKSNLEDFNCF